MWITRVLLAVMGVFVMTVRVNSSQTVMKDMTKNFLKAYEACAKEINLPESTVAELTNFWKEGFEVKSREAGCAIMCLSTKLNLIDPEGKLHHGNTAEFAKQHGSDDATAKQVVDSLHGCEQSAAPNEDHCMRTLDIAMCFKREMHKLNWAPDPQVLFDEMLAEVPK